MLGSWDLKNWMVFSDGESEGKYGKINTNNWYMQMILEVIRSLYCNLSPAQSSNSQVCFFCYSSSDWLVRFRMSECCKKSRSLTDFLKIHWRQKYLKMKVIISSHNFLSTVFPSCQCVPIWDHWKLTASIRPRAEFTQLLKY